MTARALSGFRDEVELYDLAGDPGEEHDLSSSRPEMVSQLRATLRVWQRQGETPRAFATPALKPDTLDALHSLGYVE